MFEVPAGGRPYCAVELLVKQKRMAKTQAVPCVVREGGLAEDDSLAENDERVGLHPLDQFRAFKTLSDAGLSDEDIAARHFVTPAIVKQRLRLASVSPKLHDVYAEDGITLEQLMAFSVTADQARQEQVWENAGRSGHDEPYQIQRALTEHTSQLRELEGKPADLTTEEQATIDALNAEQAKLEFDYQDADELPDEVDQRLSEIEAALMALEERSVVFESTDIARAGVFVSIDAEGRLSVDRGYVRPEDEAPREDPQAGQGVDISSSEGQESDRSGVQRTAISVAGNAADSEDDDEDAARPLPERLVIELTAHRTLALRDALAENPTITFQAVLHNFVLTAFYRFATSGSFLEIGLRTPTFPTQAPGLRESASAKAVEARHESWKARLPKDENDLWDTPTALDGTAQASLFAQCASFAVNAICEPANRYNEGRVSAHGVRARLDQAMCWPAPSGSTWSRPAGSPRSTTISAVSPSPASSRRFGKQRASRRLNSSTI